MATIELSQRGLLASQTPLRIDSDLYFEAMGNLYDAQNNPDGVFPLNVAENKLSWPLLKSKLEAISSTQKIPDWVSGYSDTLGAPSFKQAVANFLSEHLTHCPIEAGRLAFSAGATAVIEMTAFILGNEGDIAVFPAPSYPVYKNDIGNMAGLVRHNLITHTELTELDNGPLVDIAHLEKTLLSLEQEGKKFKILVLTHPDNPTGGMYTVPQLEAISNWCIAHHIHLVVNELYALSIIDTKHPDIVNDYKEYIPFVSFAQMMATKKSPYLHLLYAFSKDFGISGFRVGLVYSFNDLFLKAYQNINLSHTISNHTQWLLQTLLEDNTFIKSYIERNQAALTASYAIVVNCFKALNIPYVAARGSLFVWFDLSEFMQNPTPEAEHVLWKEIYEQTKILLMPGDGFGHVKRGQFRLVYPYLTKVTLEVAIGNFVEYINKKRVNG
jgi:aspartate/methionine/tyrosine aminotransferase